MIKEQLALQASRPRGACAQKSIGWSLFNSEMSFNCSGTCANAAIVKNVDFF
jgi:hypothetical protein